MMNISQYADQIEANFDQKIYPQHFSVNLEIINFDETLVNKSH